jgi:hypothetical protein
MKTFECTIELGCTNPVREAETIEEFVDNLVDEYNGICGELFKVTSSMITDIREVG